MNQHSIAEISRKSQFRLVALTVAALAPFLNKAFHIDDPLFLWMAQQIAKHPLDPYGFAVNWSTTSEPVWKVMQNPPLCSYYLAAIGSIAGWSELTLHAAFLIWPVLSLLATFAIARRFCREPFMAALLTLFTPVFLVSATNVMCDLMLLALWLWCIECWIAGLEHRGWLLVIISAFLAAAAALTKYFAISLVPLLAAYTLMCHRRRIACLALLLIPVATLVAFELVTKSHYGTGLLIGAVFLSREMTNFWPPLFGQFIIGLAYTGGCLCNAIFFGFPRKWKLWLIVIIGIFVFLLLFRLFVPLGEVLAIGQNTGLVRIEGGLFATIGGGILALVVADLVRRRERSSFLFFFWVLGTFSFATFCNWSITARTILPIAPVIAILVMRSLEGNSMPRPTLWRYVAITSAAAISLIVSAADYRQAESGRYAASEFQRRFQGEGGTTWFESHWGFQYYMQRWGAQPVNAADSQISPNDVLIFPANSSAIIPLPLEWLFPPETVEFPLLPFVSTHGRGTGAAFYSSARGVIPWAVDHVQPEIYYVMQFR